MSDMEHITGKLVKEPIVGSVEKTALAILNKKVVKREEYYDTALKQLLSEEDYFMRNNILYRVQKDSENDGEDVFNANPNPDGTIDFELVYYNGGCCLSEALGYALKKMEKKTANENLG